MVQTSSQLVPEAAVAARYQHSAAVTVRHVAAALAGNQLGEGEDQQGGEGDDGDDLADEESGGHAGEASCEPLCPWTVDERRRLRHISLFTT